MIDAWRESGVFEVVEATCPVPFGRDDPLAFTGEAALVTAGVFDMLGVRPMHGRAFQPHGARPGADDVVVISETLWRSVFGADTAALGRRLDLSGEPVVVIGIMPGSFRFSAPTSWSWLPWLLKAGSRLTS